LIYRGLDTLETEEIIVAIDKAANTIAAPNWADKASVIISIISAIISFAAVVVAGFVAWKQIGIAKKQNEIAETQANIADKQNKIALFEKRYELYRIILECTCFGEYFLDKVEDTSDLYKAFCLWLHISVPSGTTADKNIVVSRILEITSKLQQAEFLFSKNASRYTIRLAGYLIILANTDIIPGGNEKFEENRAKFSKILEDVSRDGILEEIELQLRLQ